MLKLEVIGNLGADATLHREQGQVFVAMNIAHTQRRKDAQGNEVEATEWVSATLNGDGGNLLPYLKKGTRVYAYGDMTLRLFHSEKDRRMKAGVNMFIRSIELIGAMPDAVPRDLYDVDGAAHRTAKYYYCDTVKSATLVDRRGMPFSVDANGWVTPVQATPQSATDANSNESAVNECNSGNS